MDNYSGLSTVELLTVPEDIRDYAQPVNRDVEDACIEGDHDRGASAANSDRRTTGKVVLPLGYFASTVATGLPFTSNAVRDT